MTRNIYLSLLILCVTIYMIRLLPLLFLRDTLKSRWLKSFLYYVPYVTLAVMTFPAILTASDHVLAGAAALVVGLAAAWLNGDLFVVAISCCATVFLAGLFL